MTGVLLLRKHFRSHGWKLRSDSTGNTRVINHLADFRVKVFQGTRGLQLTLDSVQGDVSLRISTLISFLCWIRICQNCVYELLLDFPIKLHCKCFSLQTTLQSQCSKDCCAGRDDQPLEHLVRVVSILHASLKLGNCEPVRNKDSNLADNQDLWDLHSLV